MLTVARMEVKLGVHVYYVFMTTTTNSLRHFSLKLLLHSSNSLIAARIEVKLGVLHDNHNNKYPQALFFKITSSLFKLANGTTHGG